MIVIAGIGCAFDTGSSCAAYTDAKGVFSDAGQRLLGPFLIFIAGFLLISCRRFVIGFVKAIVSIPFFILRALAATFLFILRALVKLPAWLHYVFVPHPAARVLDQPHGSVRPRPIDCPELANALNEKDKPPFWFWWVPSFVSRNMNKKAKAYEERLRAEADMLEAAVERERARDSYEHYSTRGK
jgi:hypothetical protein